MKTVWTLSVRLLPARSIRRTVGAASCSMCTFRPRILLIHQWWKLSPPVMALWGKIRRFIYGNVSNNKPVFFFSCAICVCDDWPVIKKNPTPTHFQIIDFTLTYLARHYSSPIFIQFVTWGEDIDVPTLICPHQNCGLFIFESSVLKWQFSHLLDIGKFWSTISKKPGFIYA